MTTENISGPNKSTAKPKVSKRATGKTVSKAKTQVAKTPVAEKQVSKAPAKMGRPSNYNERLAEEFCRRIALGRSLRSVCEDPDMPGSTTVIDWKLENVDFAARYARAMEDRGLSYGDQISDLISKVLDGKYEVDRARLALDGLKWTAARLAPKQYGDKQSVEVTADIGQTAAAVLMDLTARAKAKQEHTLIDITPRRFADTLPSEQEQ
jgi:hypothetical protein